MTADELIARVQSAASVRLLFDTNAVEKNGRFHRLCDQVNRLNHTFDEPRVAMYVSAAAHAEKLFHLKQKLGDEFDVHTAMAGLNDIGVDVLPFATQHAHATAELLGERYPDRDAWRDAKRKRCLHCLHAKAEDSKGRNCNATIDWLIAAHAVHERCILVTDDRGVEFKDVLEKIRLESLERAVGELLDSDAPGSQGAQAP